MKEFDFDELDKAVNSLMADAKEKNEIPPEVTASSKDEPVLEITPVEKPQDHPKEQVSPVADKPVESIVAPSSESASLPATSPTPKQGQEVTEPPSTKPIIPPRRSGRFMDVVHPSSDMRSGFRVHSSVSVAPAPAKEAPTTDVLTEALIPAIASPDVPQSDDTLSGFDPIAFQEKIDAKANDEAEPVKTEEAEVSSEWLQKDNDVLAPTVSESEQPNDEAETIVSATPFLADAKVEKRPLNSSSPSLLDLSSEETHTNEAADVPTSTPQPAEFGSDILAIESGLASTSPIEAADEPKPTYEGVTTTSAPVASGNVSIAQQYKEQPSSTPEAHQAIYDSASQPALAHPAKKRSGWFVVLWIVLLLALGGGGAAALYMLNMM